MLYKKLGKILTRPQIDKLVIAVEVIFFMAIGWQLNRYFVSIGVDPYTHGPVRRSLGMLISGALCTAIGLTVLGIKNRKR